MAKATKGSSAEEYTYTQEETPSTEPEAKFSPSSFDVNSAAAEALPEEMPDLDGMAAEPSVGAWPNGWYTAEVLEGYATRSGKQIESSDAVSSNGTSRNVLLALKINGPGGDIRNNLYRLNYRADDFSPEVMKAVKEARVEFAGMKEWPGEAKKLQARSLALGRVGQVQKAFGFKFGRRGDGGLNPLVFVGQKLDIRLRTNEDGYNEVAEVAKLGERTSKTRRSNRK